MTIFVVEGDTPGCVRSRGLDKIGMHSQDTAELFFDNVRVPVENRLGEEGDGWDQLMHNLPQERLSIALSAVAQAKYTFDLTLEYAKTRRAFGDTIGSREHTKFTLASIYTEIEVAQNFVDRCLTDHVSGALDPVAAAGAKMWCTEMQQGVADRCLQIHGGYGFMRENQVARAFIDGRAQTIYGGTSEIMRQIVSKSLGL